MVWKKYGNGGSKSYEELPENPKTLIAIVPENYGTFRELWNGGCHNLKDLLVRMLEDPKLDEDSRKDFLKALSIIEDMEAPLEKITENDFRAIAEGEQAMQALGTVYGNLEGAAIDGKDTAREETQEEK